MSRISCRRFSSGLSILAVVAVGYSLGAGVGLARADDGPQAHDNSPEVEMMEIPGAFKNLPEANDAITSKRVGEPELIESAHLSLEQLAVDATKGVFAPTEDSELLLDFHATAYCLKGRTASGEHVRQGVIAADPRVLPLGTVVHLRAGRYTGTYTVLDTGGRIRGRLIDVYVPTYKEAMQFGRRPVKIKIVGKAKRSRDSADKSPVVAEAMMP